MLSPTEGVCQCPWAVTRVGPSLESHLLHRTSNELFSSGTWHALGQERVPSPHSQLMRPFAPK